MSPTKRLDNRLLAGVFTICVAGFFTPNCAPLKKDVKWVLDEEQKACVLAQPLEALVPEILIVCKLGEDMEPLVSNMQADRLDAARKAMACETAPSLCAAGFHPASSASAKPAASAAPSAKPAASH